ncbi:RNA-directed DNA polymerase, eukaryota, reverse transcriptase zinc-binding domain protein [Tanacetum coccineum]
MLSNCNEIVDNGGVKSKDGVGSEENAQKNQVEKRNEDIEMEDVRVVECLDVESGKSECNTSRNMRVNGSNESDKKGTEQKGNDYEVNYSQRTYAKMVTKDMKIVNNKLDFVPTVISKEGSEIVIFDEALVEKGSAQWKLIVCGHFMGYKMIVHELRYHLRRMLSKWGIDDIDLKADGTCMFKFRNEEVNILMEAWSTEGISALASCLGKPLIMDNMTARRCQFWEGRMDFARVLVEFDVMKGFKEKIEIQYRDMNNNKKGSKYVKVEYAWKPEICPHCHVFGHNFSECTKRERSEKELVRDANNS